MSRRQKYASWKPNITLNDAYRGKQTKIETLSTTHFALKKDGVEKARNYVQCIWFYLESIHFKANTWHDQSSFWFSIKKYPHTKGGFGFACHTYGRPATKGHGGSLTFTCKFFATCFTRLESLAMKAWCTQICDKGPQTWWGWVQRMKWNLIGMAHHKSSLDRVQFWDSIGGKYRLKWSGKGSKQLWKK